MKNRCAQGTMAFIYALMLMYGVSSQIIGSLVSRIMLHYGINMAQGSLMMSFTSVGNFIAIMLVTIVVGRMHKILLVGASVLLYGMGFLLISFVPPYGYVLMCFAVIGIVGASLDTVCNSVTADLTPQKVSRNVSILHGMFGLGGLLGPLAMEALANVLTWERVFFAISIAFLAFFLAYTVFVRIQWKPLTQRLPLQPETSRIRAKDLLEVVRRKRNVLLMLTMFFYGGHQTTLTLWVKRYMEAHLGVPEWGAWALSLVWLGTVASRMIVSPVLGKKAAPCAKILFGNAAAALALALGLLSGTAWGMMAAALVMGVCSGFSLPLAIATGCEWYPESTVMGTLIPFTSFFVACVAMPPLSGMISDALGIAWGIALSVVCGALVALCAGLLRSTLR